MSDPEAATSAAESKTSAHPSVLKYAKHVNPEFVKLLGVFGYGRLLTRARDVWIWDHEDRRYLDCLAGFGSVNIGHNHPRLIERLKRFLDEEALNIVHIGPSTHWGELAERLAILATRAGSEPSPPGDPLEIVLLSSSGAEAVESGLKLARAATDRAGVVHCDGGYHGTSLGTLSISGWPRMRAPFEPLLDGAVSVPWGDLEALERALAGDRMGAFVVDPFLCEQEACPPAGRYLRRAAELCRHHGTLFVLDEVQTGLGRTGTMFAYQGEGVVPDVLCLAKSLSGGIAPVGATLTTAEVHTRAYGKMDRFDLDNSTFGGNAFSCTAALETLAILEDERLPQNAAARGEQLLEGLRERLAGHRLVRDIRGRGLLVSIELGPTDRGWMNKLAPGLVTKVSRDVFGQWACVKLLEKGLIVQPATQNWNILKLEPPLTIQAEQIETVVATIGEVLDGYQGIRPLITDVTKRIGKQFLAGWAF